MTKTHLELGQISHVYLWIDPQWYAIGQDCNAEIQKYHSMIDFLSRSRDTGLLELPEKTYMEYMGLQKYSDFVLDIEAVEKRAKLELSTRFQQWSRRSFVKGNSEIHVDRIRRGFKIGNNLEEITVFGKNKDGVQYQTFCCHLDRLARRINHVVGVVPIL